MRVRVRVRERRHCGVKSMWCCFFSLFVFNSSSVKLFSPRSLAIFRIFSCFCFFSFAAAAAAAVTSVRVCCLLSFCRFVDGSTTTSVATHSSLRWERRKSLLFQFLLIGVDHWKHLAWQFKYSFALFQKKSSVLIQTWLSHSKTSMWQISIILCFEFQFFFWRQIACRQHPKVTESL